MSAWLHRVPRCFPLIRRSALVDISARTLRIHLKNVFKKNQLNTHSRELSKHHKRSEYRFNYFFIVHLTCVQCRITTNIPSNSHIICLQQNCQSLAADRLTYSYFNRWAAQPSLNPSEALSITGSMRGGLRALRSCFTAHLTTSPCTITGNC